MDKIKVTLLVFVLVSILDITGIIFEIPILVFIFKPLILLSLLVLYVISVSKRNKWYVLALLFSFLGDVFLILKGEELYFILGLISFLLAHILFIKIVFSWLYKSSTYKKIGASIPFLITFFGLIYLLKDSLNELLIPVIVYGFTISLFGVISLLNYLNTKTTKALFMFLGALVFIISDSILAINKFYEPAHIFEVIVMITYVLAQYFIYKSITQKNAL